MNPTSNPFGEPSHPQGVTASRKLRSATKTFSIVLLVLGSLNVASAISIPIFAALGQMFLSMASESGEENADIKRATAEFNNLLSPFNLSVLAASFLVGLGMVTGGIATLYRKRWGAQLLRGCAGLMVILTLVQSSVQIYSRAMNKEAMMQDLEKQMNRVGTNQLPEGFENFAQVFFLIQLVFEAFFSLAFVAVYMWALLHFSKATTLEQFELATEPMSSKP